MAVDWRRVAPCRSMSTARRLAKAVWRTTADGVLRGRDLRRWQGVGSVVSPDYGPKDNEFSGEVNWVQIDLGKDDHDHLISPEERFNVAMARQ